MSKLIELLQSEPVRMYLYSLLAPLLGVLVGYGVVESDAVPLFLALGAAVLGVPAVEGARRVVASPKTQSRMMLAGDGTAGDSNAYEPFDE